MGVLISIQPPTKPMLKEAAEAGFHQVPGPRDKYPRLQILNIAELLGGERVEYPRFAADATFNKAPKARKAAEEHAARPRDRRTVLLRSPRQQRHSPRHEQGGDPSSPVDFLMQEDFRRESIADKRE